MSALALQEARLTRPLGAGLVILAAGRGDQQGACAEEGEEVCFVECPSLASEAGGRPATQRWLAQLGKVASSA